MRYAQHKGIRSVLYLGPIRPIRPNPNSPESIARFRHDIKELSLRYNAICLDYTSLVPEPYWTNYETNGLTQLTGDAGQLDFAHLRAPAHKMIAERLVQDVGASILSQSGTSNH